MAKQAWPRVFLLYLDAVHHRHAGDPEFHCHVTVRDRFEKLLRQHLYSLLVSSDDDIWQ
jgi:hypothetical protein